jgi:hypothetical protein
MEPLKGLDVPTLLSGEFSVAAAVCKTDMLDMPRSQEKSVGGR